MLFLLLIDGCFGIVMCRWFYKIGTNNHSFNIFKKKPNLFITIGRIERHIQKDQKTMKHVQVFNFNKHKNKIKVVHLFWSKNISTTHSDFP